MLALGLSVDDNASPAADIEEQCTALAAPRHRQARELFEHWRDVHARGGFIVGVHIPSRKLARLLPALSLHEPVDGGRDFHTRLAGALLLRRFGRDITGRRLTHLFGPKRHAFHCGLMQRTVQHGEPFVLDVRAKREGLTRLHFELLGLQVFSPDCRHAWVLSGHFHFAD
jgi:hypothetical protein